MQYQKVFVNDFSYVLPSMVVTSSDLEEQLRPAYDRLNIPKGQIESLTGIKERRWWPLDYPIATGARLAAEKVCKSTGFKPQDLDVLIFAGVCRDYFEPATACRVGAELGLASKAMVYDISNACLGVLNGIVDVANRIELGQIKSGLVVSCESSRGITEDTIRGLIREPNMAEYMSSLATFTGGSGAAAVLLTDGSYNLDTSEHRLLGGACHSSLEHHKLCLWGLKKRSPAVFEQFIKTDAVNVLRYGLDLGAKTFDLLMKELGWCRELIDKVISHQVGRPHRESILRSLGIRESRDFPTYKNLGNIGTVSLPLTTALACEKGFLKEGDQVGLLGIGSGLNCLMLGVKW